MSSQEKRKNTGRDTRFDSSLVTGRRDGKSWPIVNGRWGLELLVTNDGWGRGQNTTRTVIYSKIVQRPTQKDTYICQDSGNGERLQRQNTRRTSRETT